MAVIVPAGFTARPYQKELYNCLARDVKRGVVVWHRRAGKDKIFMAMMAAAAMQRVGSYFYILPFYKQAKKIIWNGMDKDGKKYTDVFPNEVIAHRDNQEMILTLVNGSMIYFLGSDNIDSIVGTNPVGIFFSEFSLHKPQVWDFLRPILIENNGFAFFNGTPRGKNHFYTMLKAAERKPDEWFSQVLTINETGVMTDEAVEKEIEDGMDRATAKQEFYCSFSAALTGAYYDEVMVNMEQEGRTRDFPTDPYIPVDVAWDLGISDMCILVFSQAMHNEIRIIDVLAENGKGLDYYVKQLQNRPYVYGYHYLPHDIKARELGNNGKTRLKALQDLGLKNLVVNPRDSVEDGINETRKILYKTYIHPRCDKLIEALKTYRANFDYDKQVYTKPIHDWSSHYADAVRQLAMGLREKIDTSKLTPVAHGTGYNPLDYADPANDVPQYSQPHTHKRQSVKERYDRAQMRPSAEVVNQGHWNPSSWNPRDHTIADSYYD